MTTAALILDNAPAYGVCSAKALCQEFCVKHENNVYTFEDGSMIVYKEGMFSEVAL